ncbi:O-antigen ligase family protein [Anaerohalosphaera lusitana]|nr:hypothetical protein [Anaerohalosphaera lusitana]
MSYTVFRIAKICVISTIMIFSLLLGYLNPKRVLSNSIIIAFLFFVTTAFAVALGNEKNSTGAIFGEFSDFAFAGLTVVLFFNLHQRHPNSVNKVFKSGYVLLCFMALFPVLNFLIGWPDIQPPKFGREVLLSFWSTGFAGSRTNWSTGLALFVPISFLFTINYNHRLLVILTRLVLLSPIIASQLFCGSRGGLLATISALGYITVKCFNVRYLLILMAIIGIISICVWPFIVEHLRLGRQDISTGRLQQYGVAIEAISSPSLLGQGIDGSKRVVYHKVYEDHEVHNVVLRAMIDYGPLVYVSVVAFFIILLMRILFSAGTLVDVVCYAIILTILVTSMFEPNGFIGGFQNKFLFWAALGIVVSIEYTEQYKKSKDKRHA